MTVEELLKQYAEEGNLEELQKLIAAHDKDGSNDLINPILDKNIFYIAATNGHKDILEYLVTRFKSPMILFPMIYRNNNLAFKDAIKNGHVGVVKYLIDIYPAEKRNGMIEYAFGAAANAGHIELLKSMADLIQDPSARAKMMHAENDLAFKLAVMQGKTECADFIRKDAGISGYACARAAVSSSMLAGAYFVGQGLFYSMNPIAAVVGVSIYAAASIYSLGHSYDINSPKVTFLTLGEKIIEAPSYAAKLLNERLLGRNAEPIIGM